MNVDLTDVAVTAVIEGGSLVISLRLKLDGTAELPQLPKSAEAETTKPEFDNGIPESVLVSFDDISQAAKLLDPPVTPGIVGKIHNALSYRWKRGSAKTKLFFWAAGVCR